MGEAALTDSLGHNKLEGARAIAAYLGYGDTEEGERKVRHLRARADGCPIRKRKGVGLYAFKSELSAWFEAEETLPVQQSA